MPWRRRYKRSWRRPIFRHRRRRRRYHHWRPRWRRYRRSKVRKIYQTQPKRIQPLLVQGWEILGVQGTQLEFHKLDEAEKWDIHIRHLAPTNKMVDYLSKMQPIAIENKCSDTWQTPGPSYWDFVGGYGQAKFDLQSLVLRNLLGFNRFSEDIRKFTHIKFRGLKFQLIRAPTLDYLFRPQMHRGPFDLEYPLLHPANLLNMPWVKWVQSVARSNCCRSPSIKRRPPPDLSGWFDIETFRNYELITYQWSVFDPNNPMGRNTKPVGAGKTDKFFDDGWMNIDTRKANINVNLNERAKWGDRWLWDTNFVQDVNKYVQNEQNPGVWDVIWNQTNQPQFRKAKMTPFLPPMIESDEINTFWFRYKFFFLLGGSTISRSLQKWPIRETQDDIKYCDGGANPQECQYCIDPERDLDAYGLLTKKAFKRITEPAQHRKKKLVEKLARIIRHRRKRKRVTWWDTSTTHPDSKKKKSDHFGYMATRLRF
nr:MAG: ORF1 [Anelloviridae sp.]